MRKFMKVFVAMLVVCSFASVVEAKKFFFPRVLGHNEREFVGITFLNNSTTTSSFSCMIFDERGNVFSIPPDVILQPGEQRARLATEWFGPSIVGKRLWVMIETDNEESDITSFFLIGLIGQNNLRYLDGGVPLTEEDLGTDIFVPSIFRIGSSVFKPTIETEIGIFNPNNEEVTVFFQAISTGGGRPREPRTSITIPPFGTWQNTTTEAMFKVSQFPVLILGAYRLTSNVPIGAFEIVEYRDPITKEANSIFTASSVRADAVKSSVVFPFYAVGDGFDSELEFLYPEHVSGETTSVVFAYMYNTNHELVEGPVLLNRSSAGGKERVRLSNIMDVGENLQTGFIVLEGLTIKTQVIVHLLIKYRRAGDNQLTQVTYVPALTPAREVVFSHTAQFEARNGAPGIYTGVAFSFVDFHQRFSDERNINNLPPYIPTPRELRMELFNSSGNLVAEHTWTGTDRQSVARLISEWFGVTESVGGKIVLSSDDPFYSLSIFGGDDYWSIIPAQILRQ